MTNNFKKYIPLYLFLLLVGLPSYAGESIDDFLKKLPLKNIRVMEKESFYNNIYEVLFEQPIDHRDTTKGYFSQRLYISHVDASKPVVLVTEGYNAGHYYTSEPASLMQCNQIIAEHRYFGESVPDSIQWEFLTTWQSASDHHQIINAFKKFYTGKWITTGISKGGQTVMFHSYYYPEDVSLRIPYVAPLNNCVEDERIYHFLDHVGSRKCRKKIREFQEMALREQDTLLPVFKSFSKRKNYTYDIVGGFEKAYEYSVLEYSFAFWQWGYCDCIDIPDENSSPSGIISHMNMVAGFDYFADQFIQQYQPFFYQAYTEMGYYGYDLEEFAPLLRHVTDGRFNFTLPSDIPVTFNDSILIKVEGYIRKEANNFIFIYGEYDTWSATAVRLSNKTNSKIFYKNKGSHRTRISNMPENQQKKVIETINDFLES
ncbi:MAG: aminopeptidase [Bacteroidales bacterium]|nr:aminopeptidase [Bacteroidales bacterium]